MMSNVAQAPYLASIEAVSHIAKVCPWLRVDMSNVSNQGLFLRVVDFPSDSDREVEAVPAPANLLGEETSGNASGPVAPVQIADYATAQTAGQEASGNGSGSVASVQPEADAAPPILTRAEQWKANRSAWI